MFRRNLIDLLKKKTVKIVAFGVALATALSVTNPLLGFASFKYKNYNLDTVITYKGIEPVYIIDNEKMTGIRPAIIDNSNGAAMCGANEVFRDCIGVDVVYKKKKETLTFTYNNHELIVKLNSKVGTLDGNDVALPNAPFRMKYYDGTIDTFVPSKFVATALGLAYEWNSTDNTISIKRPHIIYVNDERTEYTGTYGKIYLDGEPIRLKKTPSYIMSDTAMVNAKKVIGQIDEAEYYYNKKNQSVYITAGDIELKFRLGDRNVYRNGVIEAISNVPVKIYDEAFGVDAIYLPGRYLFNALGLDYEWDSAEGASKITTTDRIGVYEPQTVPYVVIDSMSQLPMCGELEQHLEIPLPDGNNGEPLIKEDYYNNRIIIDLKGDYTEFYSPVCYTHDGNELVNPDHIHDENMECGCYYMDRFRLVGNAIQQAQVYYLEDSDTTRIYLYAYCNMDQIFPGSTFELSDNSVKFDFDMPKDIYDKIIVLDAGHGDYDPGTVHGGYNEKDLNLAIVYEYCKELFDDSDIKVYYSRSDDTLIPLMDRATLAKHVQADFFISVHHNSSSNSSANGTSVYYSPTNAGKFEFNGYTGKDIAELLLNNIVNKLGTKNFGLGSTEFTVTKYNTVPSVLIECGFMSNPDELSLLVKSKTQKKIAQCIYNMVNKIYNNPIY